MRSLTSQAWEPEKEAASLRAWGAGGVGRELDEHKDPEDTVAGSYSGRRKME